jgi:hypothetical protein
MVFLRIHLAVILAALLLSGCKFEPAVYGLGYQECDTTADCNAGGMVCLKGLCVPDCQGAYTVAWLEPETRETVDWICPGAECGVEEDLDLGIKFFGAALPPGTFLDLFSQKDSVEPCNRVVIRFSILAPDEEGPQGLELSVVIRSKEATGLVPGVLSLTKYDVEEDIYKQFREHTHFYVVDTDIFAWPVRLRLVPIASNTTAFFGIRDFEMSCCD